VSKEIRAVEALQEATAAGDVESIRIAIQRGKEASVNTSVMKQAEAQIAVLNANSKLQEAIMACDAEVRVIVRVRC